MQQNKYEACIQLHQLHLSTGSEKKKKELHTKFKIVLFTYEQLPQHAEKVGKEPTELQN